MHTFLIVLAVIAAVAGVVFLYIVLYKHEVAQEKAREAQYAARKAEEDAAWERIDQNLRTAAENWGKVRTGIAQMNAQLDERARIQRQQANLNKA
jgi:flagellar basal body-associated protein FliL